MSSLENTDRGGEYVVKLINIYNAGALRSPTEETIAYKRYDAIAMLCPLW